MSVTTPAVTVGPLVDGDMERLARMFERLSPETRYRRFFSPQPVLRAALLEALARSDGDQTEALVARLGDEIIAVANYGRTEADPSVAEVAVVVEDAWHRRGVGRKLMRELARLARARGVKTIAATTMPDNQAALALARATSPMGTSRWDGGMIEFMSTFPEARPERATLSRAA